MRRKDSVNLGSQNTRREVMERGFCDTALSGAFVTVSFLPMFAEGVGGWWRVVRRGGVWRM